MHCPANHPPTPAPGPADAGQVRLGPGVFVRESDLVFTATRSSGPGGQNVNKRSTRVELRIDPVSIPLDPPAMRRLKRLAGAKLIGSGELVISAQDERSQKRNKDACLMKLRELVIKAMVRPKPRIKTKPGRGAIERRLREKHEQAEKKRRRTPPPQGM